MNRTGLLVALALAAVLGLIFGLYPDLDLAISGYFAGQASSDVFPLRADFWLWLIKESSMVAIWVMIAPVAVALVLKLVRPRTRMLIPGRTVVFLAATLILAPGVVANGIFKENWGRPRPIDVTNFHGAHEFVPWWNPRGTCPENCSFVSGDASAAYWTLAPAALAPPAWRPLAYAAALTFGTVVGLLRVIFGGHFPSDVIFAGIFTFLLIWAAYTLLYRRAGASAADDDAIEHAIGQLTLPIDTAIRRYFGLRQEPDKP